LHLLHHLPLHPAPRPRGKIHSGAGGRIEVTWAQMIFHCTKMNIFKGELMGGQNQIHIESDGTQPLGVWKDKGTTKTLTSNVNFA